VAAAGADGSGRGGAGEAVLCLKSNLISVSVDTIESNPTGKTTTWSDDQTQSVDVCIVDGQ